MLPTFDQLLQLAQLPAAILLVVLVAVILIGTVRKWWVPYWLYQREQIRSDRNDETLAKVSNVVSSLTTTQAEIKDNQKRIEDKLDDLVWNRHDRYEARGGR